MRFILSILLCLSLTVIYSQQTTGIDDLDKKHRNKYKQALEAIKEKNHDKAVNLLDAVTTAYPEFADAHFKKARQLFKLDEKEEALESLERAFALQAKPSQRITMMLVQLYEENSNYDDAINTVTRFKKSLRPDHELHEYADHTLKLLRFRKDAYANPLDIDIEYLPPEINGPHGDYLPAINADGTQFIFTKRLPSEHYANPYNSATQEDLYISYIDEDGHFSQSEPIEDLNTASNEGAHCFSQDGTILIFTACDRGNRQNGCDLYISFHKNGIWSEPQNMGPQINTRYWESQPSLSPDNTTLYFSSTRKGGYGKKDIWKVSLENGMWSEPTNLGPVINSAQNEESPFIHADNNTLYFRSDGHIGLGGYDLFKSTMKKDNWTEPINLGYPVNTSDDEGALFVNISGSKAYYTTNYNNAERNFDIASFDLPEQLKPNPVSYVKFIITDSHTGKALDAIIDINHIDGTMQATELVSDLKGQALVVLNLGEYLINVKKPGYILRSENMQLNSFSELKEPYLFEIALDPIDKIQEEEPEPVVLNNIFFASGSAELLDKSEPELNNLLELLNSTPNLHLTIIGHTDDVGSESDNMQLSILRARAVHDRLIDKGAIGEQLHFEGRGETEPIVQNTDDASRAINRRTEFIARLLD